MNGDLLPDEDHVLRHCSGNSIERNHEGEPIGITADAFDDDDPNGISVTWLEHFRRFADQEQAAINAIRSTRTVRPRHRFGKLNVGLIRAAGEDFGVELRVEHAPRHGNSGHSLIKGIVPAEHQQLMSRLAIELVALLA